MSLEQNKAFVRQSIEEVWNQGKLERIDESVSPNFVSHTLGVTPYGSDREGYRQRVATTLKSFPDFHVAIEDMVAEDDKVIFRFTATGTNTGDGPGGAATGKAMKIPGFAMWRIRDCEVVEAWLVQDDLLMLQQLGLLSTPVQQATTA